MVDTDRCVIVRMDKTTGEVFISPEMLRNYYDFSDSVQLCENLRKQMGELCDFFIVPYIPAVTLITAELLLKAKYAEDPNNQTVTN